MTSVGERIPNGYKVKDESGHRPLTGQGGGSGPRLGFMARAIDFHGAGLGVNQPSQLSAVGQPLLHLFPQDPNLVCLGTQLDDETGTYRPEAAKGSGIQILDALLEDPRRIGRTPRAIGQQPTGGRIKGDASLVLTGPVPELRADFVVARTGPRVSQRHDDEFPVGGHFQTQVWMFGAELGKGFVGHGADGQDGGQVGLIDHECHAHSIAVGAFSRGKCFGFGRTSRQGLRPERRHHRGHGFDRTREISMKPAVEIAETAKAWGQNDDITEVTVRRTA